MGFQDQIQAILGELPSLETQPRQTMLFSATWPQEVRQLASQYLRAGDDTVHISIGEHGQLNANKAIKQVGTVA